MLGIHDPQSLGIFLNLINKEDNIKVPTFIPNSFLRRNNSSKDCFATSILALNCFSLSPLSYAGGITLCAKNWLTPKLFKNFPDL